MDIKNEIERVVFVGGVRVNFKNEAELLNEIDCLYGGRPSETVYDEICEDCYVN